MRSLRVACVLALALLATTTPARSEQPAGSAAVRRALHTASVVLDGCSGVLAESPGVVVTARHCVKSEGQELRVRFTNGASRQAWVAAIDEVSDQALLLVEDPPPITPLPLVHRRPIVGTVLYFEGNPARARFQSARLDRIGLCPSLPNLPNALFTSIHGVPGDSGAPLVDGAARIVGLVHGGAQCRIATPADTLGRLIDRVLGDGSLQMALRSAEISAPLAGLRPLSSCGAWRLVIDPSLI
jgi:S1-C subfamily serine protease